MFFRCLLLDTGELATMLSPGARRDLCSRLWLLARARAYFMLIEPILVLDVMIMMIVLFNQGQTPFE